jgi:AcrR family transcriptional regulator
MTSDTATGHVPYDEKLSPWQERTLERNLIDAKRRLLTKSSRFVQAAYSLLYETGGLDFTVQDVVERSKLSLRGFYQAFASKDDLLLALFEEYVAAGAAAQREILRGIDDPIEQIHTYLMSFWGGASDSNVVRALSHFHLTLALARPADVEHALEPPHTLLLESVERGVALGTIRGDIAANRLAEILLHTGITAVHVSVTRSRADLPSALPDEVWAFCLNGLRAPAG